jgi:hypothetical protein
MQVENLSDQEKITSAVLASMPAPQRQLIEKISDVPGDADKEPIDPDAPKEAAKEPDPKKEKEPEPPPKKEELEPDPRVSEAKILQSLQQEIRQLQRKKDAQGELNEVQEAKLSAASKKADKLADKLKDFLVDDLTQIDPYTGIKTLAVESVDMERRLTQLESENQKLQKKERFSYWEHQAEKFDGVNVTQVWENAIDDALKQSGVARAYHKYKSGQMSQDDFDELLNGQASDLYHERVRTAKASVDGKKKAAAENKVEKKDPAPTARAVPPPSPGGAGSAQNAGASQGQSAQQVRDAQLLELIERKLAY